ncbi:hypothetical protein Psi02_16580 [Planotetraspora silvatica]|uniref:Uncharacterized protein n=1 Tax=Planotetraspora silvatica TaxID=234614 RepID=A0A8J3UGL7_9ACTN|nr:hypothetical protein [Planotetraspora silvatica]GII45234.1 hypothetical protein Psi02_16580 [Planotetraspora silvatica]
MNAPPPPDGPAGPPGSPPPGPPYGGPPVRYEPRRPGTPRRRGRIGRILAVVLSLAAAGGVVAGIIYYEQSYKPRHYLREWSFRIAAPQGRFNRIELGADEHATNIRFTEQCHPASPCDPPPVKAVADWVASDGGVVTEKAVAECFKDGGSFSYDHERHPVSVRCEKVDSPRFRYTFTVRLGY